MSRRYRHEVKYSKLTHVAELNVKIAPLDCHNRRPSWIVRMQTTFKPPQLRRNAIKGCCMHA